MIDNTAPLQQWKTILGDKFNIIKPYLMVTTGNAAGWPCPNGCFQIIRPVDDEIWAICSRDQRECESIQLHQDDIKLYKFDGQKMTKRLSEQLSNLPLKFNQPQCIDKTSATYQVAVYDKHHPPLTILLTALASELDIALLNQWRQRYGNYVLLDMTNKGGHLLHKLSDGVCYCDAFALFDNDNDQVDTIINKLRNIIDDLKCSSSVDGAKGGVQLAKQKRINALYTLVEQYCTKSQSNNKNYQSPDVWDLLYRDHDDSDIIQEMSCWTDKEPCIKWINNNKERSIGKPSFCNLISKIRQKQKKY